MFTFNYVCAEDLVKIKEKLIELGFDQVAYELGDAEFKVGIHKDLRGRTHAGDVKIEYNGAAGFRLSVDYEADTSGDGYAEVFDFVSDKLEELDSYMLNELGIEKKYKHPHDVWNTEVYKLASGQYNHLESIRSKYEAMDEADMTEEDKQIFNEALESSDEVFSRFARSRKLSVHMYSKASLFAKRESGVVLSDEEFREMLGYHDEALDLYANRISSYEELEAYRRDLRNNCLV